MIALCTMLALLTASPASASPDETSGRGSGAAEPTPATVQNPVSDQFSDTYADPVVIRGKDGYWYLYATSDPLTEEPSEFGLMHMARSADFEDWEYLGTIFDDDNQPDWAHEDSMFWAPDIRYVDGQYVLYYSMTHTADGDGDMDYAIGSATAPTPAGPWTDTGGAVVEPRPDGEGGYFNSIDPALFIDDDGTRYLYFGGHIGGVWVTELDEDGLRAVGEPTRLTVSDRYEGAFVVKHGDYYYLTASAAMCCDGPGTGYSVYAGRSESPTGPFVDHEGVSMNESRVGGTQVLAQNGNAVIGVGHHAFFTDTTGQDWILYHGIERDDPWLDEPGGINERPTFIDRLDWVDGWPVANAGEGPTEGELTGPTTGSALDIDMNDPAASESLRTVSGDWSSVEEEHNGAGTVGLLDPTRTGDEAARVETVRPAAAESRLESDLRFPDGTGTFRLDLARMGGQGIAVEVDTDAGELRAEVAAPSADPVTEAVELPEIFDPETFTALEVEIRDGQVWAALSESRLGDHMAEVAVDAPRPVVKQRPVAWEAAGAPVQIANPSVAAVHTPVTESVEEPRADELIWSEEFDGELDEGWEWVRGSDDISVGEDGLTWPLDDGDVRGDDNDGTLLLRDAPEGEWMVQTQLTLDLGEDTVRNYQQAGLVAYVDDDDFARLGTLALHETRQAEFSRELTTDGRVDSGSHWGGPTAPQMWLRLHHRVDPDTGELHYRSATSTDGENWRWGAVWTFPAEAEPRIGLYAGGGAEPAAEAVFHSVEIHSVHDEDEEDPAGFANPVFDENFPDPFVLERDGTFYAYATNGEHGNMPVLTSADLVDWELAGDAMPDPAPWSEEGWHWAPEIIEAEPGRFLAYYTARDPELDLQCLGVAEASEPLGPFGDTADEPLVCQTEEGGSIDASPFVDDDGTPYLLWKNDGNHIDERSWIYVQELAADGLSLVGESHRLVTHDQDWEGHLVEGASIWQREGRYYMFYSANGYYSEEYGVGYAVADSVLGPWTKPSDEPLMSSNEVAAGPGHGMVLEVNDRTWYVHHAWPPDHVGDPEYGRSMWVTPLRWEGEEPFLDGPEAWVDGLPVE
ncbi:hypothetical protein GCM10027590_40430 [Nocardiopsis nanhaiensis]